VCAHVCVHIVRVCESKFSGGERWGVSFLLLAKKNSLKQKDHHPDKLLSL
jgi:hypothetical protein